MSVMSAFRKIFHDGRNDPADAERERRLVAAEKRITQNEQAIASESRVMVNMAGMMQMMAGQGNEEDR